jgi:TolA-binding protein
MSASVNIGSKLLQVVSYAINHSAALPLVARMQIADALQNYITTQETRITELEERVSQMQNKIDLLDNRHIQKIKIQEYLHEILNTDAGKRV